MAERLFKQGVRGMSVGVCRNAPWRRKIYFPDDFGDLFDERVMIVIHPDSVEVRRSGGMIDKGYKLSTKSGSGYSTELACDLPLGKYEVNEDESDEDTLVIDLPNSTPHHYSPMKNMYKSV